MEVVNKWWKGDCKQNNLWQVRARKLKVHVSCLKDTIHRKPPRILEVIYYLDSVPLFLSVSSAPTHINCFTLHALYMGLSVHHIPLCHVVPCLPFISLHNAINLNPTLSSGLDSKPQTFLRNSSDLSATWQGTKLTQKYQ